MCNSGKKSVLNYLELLQCLFLKMHRVWNWFCNIASENVVMCYRRDHTHTVISQQNKTAITHRGREIIAANWRHFRIHFLELWLKSHRISPKDPINNMPALVMILAWLRQGDKPLSESMMVSSLTHICAIRSEWVNTNCVFLDDIHHYLYCISDSPNFQIVLIVWQLFYDSVIKKMLSCW